MDDKDRIAEMYDRHLGAGLPESEAMPFDAMPVDELPSRGDGAQGGALPSSEPQAPETLFVQGQNASVGGVATTLGEEDYKAIVRIVASCIERDAIAMLEEWRTKFALREEK